MGKKQACLKQKKRLKIGKICTFDGDIFLSVALSLMCIYCWFYHLFLCFEHIKHRSNLQKSQRSGQRLKLNAILPKHPFKQACPSKNRRLQNTDDIRQHTACGLGQLEMANM